MEARSAVLAAALYVGPTVVLSVGQLVENLRYGRQGEFWAPVWWIALTWPLWVVVIGLDIPWGGQYMRGPATASPARKNEKVPGMTKGQTQ